MHRLLRSVVMVSLVLAAPGSAAETETLWVAARHCLKLRHEPATTARVERCVPRGTRLEAGEAQDGWRQVELADGGRGWMSSAFLRAAPPASENVAASGATPEALAPSDPPAAAPPAVTVADFVRLEPFAAQPAPVGAELVVERGVFRRRQLLTGELAPTRATPILVPRTRSWSVQVRWMVEDGTPVEAGDPLVEFDNSSLVSRLEDSRVAAVTAADELERARVESDRAAAEKELALERARTAREKARIDAEVPAELLSRREFQERQLQLRRAEVEHVKALEELRAQRATAAAELEIKRIALDGVRAEIAELERDLGALSPRAPESGLAIVESHPWESRKFAVGDTVWPGMTLLTLPDLTSLEVEAELIDVDDGKVVVGMPGICRLDAYPSEAYACRVRSITPVAQASSPSSLRRSFVMRLELERTDPSTMRPGMSVGIEIEGLRIEDALMAPREALDLASSPPRLLLADGGTMPLELGPCNAQACVVLEGVAAGRRLRPAAGDSR